MTDITQNLLYRIVTLKWIHKTKILDHSVKSGSDIINYEDLTAWPTIKKSLFWANIVFPSNSNGNIKISGIRNRDVQSILDKIISDIKRFHLKELSVCQLIPESLKSFKDCFNAKYIRYSVVENWKKQSENIYKRINNEFMLQSLPDKERKEVKKYLNIFLEAHNLRDKRNLIFTNRELKKFKNYFDTVEDNPLTGYQRKACVINEDNNLILAGAGSGKTSVIIAKAGYLIKTGLAKPHEILILAYGKDASKETDERIRKRIPQIKGVKTSTFHKLGLDIIGASTGIKPRVSILEEDKYEFDAFINKTINELSLKDFKYNNRIIDYFINYLVPYENQFEFNEDGDYYTALRKSDVRSLKSIFHSTDLNKENVSLKKEKLKSFEEVVIADFLFINGIEYQYEAPYKHETATTNKTQYCPDFFLPEYDIYIEHFGINRNGKVAPFVDELQYQQGMEWKRNLHNDNDTSLIESYSYEMQEGTLTDQLHKKLEENGVVFSPMSFDKLQLKLQDIKEDKRANKLNRLIANFLKMFKQSGLTFDDLKDIAQRTNNRAKAFLYIFKPILDAYNEELNKNNCIDFSDMIRDSIDLINSGQYKHHFKYILVDEFQDISAIRANMVKSLIKFGDNTSLTCVGDDWQSIYSFTGSDINYTVSFEKYFGLTEVIQLDKTFRYNDKVNSFSKKFITKNPSQLKKAINAHKTITGNGISLVGYHKDKEVALKKCIERIKLIHSDAATIYLLGRYRFSKPDSFEDISKQYPSYKFMYDTVHKSKGKEADFVIILDVNEDGYGFPSNLYDDPLMDLVSPFGDPYKHAEERRLFYVALTRTKNHTFILYDVESKSDFIKEITNNETEYNYDEISTRGVESLPPKFDYGTCPVCKTGEINMTVYLNGHIAFECENHNYCGYTPPTCNLCNKAPMDKNGIFYHCRNPKCDHKSKICTDCEGVMIKRNGKYGLFLGCSNFPECKHTEKLK